MAPDPSATKERLSSYPVVLVLIVANLAMFAVELASGVDPFNPQREMVVALGANHAPLTLHGQWWRLFSSMFLHYGVIHIAMNMLCLYQGRIVERLYGSVGFAVIYLVAGIVGSIASVARAAAPSAGASGAVFGVFGAFAAFVWLRRDRMNPEAVHQIARSLGSFFMINFAIGAVIPGIDLTAHFGGLIGGFASGAALLAGKRADGQRVLRAIAVLVGGTALAAAVVVAIPDRSLTTRFNTTQDAVFAAYKDLQLQHALGRLDGAQLADRIERDVLAPWSVTLDAVQVATEPGDKLRRFMELREEAWRAELAKLRNPTSEDLALKANQLNEAANEAANATKDDD
jgi:rhomboid protease GluP